MKTRKAETKASTAQKDTPAGKLRFQIIKLEDRIAPHKNPYKHKYK